MKFGMRILTTAVVAFSLTPVLLAQDSAQPAALATQDGFESSPAAFGALAKAMPDYMLLTPVSAAPGATMDRGVKPRFDFGASSKAQPDFMLSGTPAASPMPKSNGADDITPIAELFLGYSYVRNVPANNGNRIDYLNGGSASIAVNLNRYLGLVADFGGFGVNKFGPNGPPAGGVVKASGTVFTGMAGPRVSWRHDRFTPFLQALFGGIRATAVTVSGCTGFGCAPLPAETSFAMAAGGGLDLSLSRHVAFRVIQAEYLMTRFADRSNAALPTGTQNDMRLSTGLVFRFGGSHPTPPPPPPVNHPPVTACSADRSMVYAESGDIVSVHAQASSPDNNPLTYSWTTTGGAVEGSGPEVRWNSSGSTPGTYTVRGRVDDGRGGTADCSVDIRVEPRPNRPPTMTCSADRSSIVVGERVRITATASDPDNDPLTYVWQSNGGQIVGSGPSVSFDSTGLVPNRYTVTGRVSDGRGGTADCSVDVRVEAAQSSAPEIKELEASLALHSIYFPTAQPTRRDPNLGLTESQQHTLRNLAGDFKKYLGFKPDAHLILEGHADQRGTVEYNKALTERRVARSKSFLVEQGVPEGSIETQALGKQEQLSASQVREMIEQNPDLTPEDRRRLEGNLQVITLANNRRVDVTLSTTGQQSVRRYPFNAKDALTLINVQRTGTAKRPAPAARRKPNK